MVLVLVNAKLDTYANFTNVSALYIQHTNGDTVEELHISNCWHKI